MNRSRSLSNPAGLTEDILVVAWTVFEALAPGYPLRADFASAIWRLEDAVDNGHPLDAALVAVIQFVGQMSA